MWARLDDALLDHPKLIQAGELLGKNGQVVALGFYAMQLIWSNKHLTDGFISDATMKTFRVENPTALAGVLVRAGLLDRVAGGYQVHDFAHWNPTAATVKKRRADRHAQRNGSAATRQ